jgi:hypothetical protein
MMLVVGKHLLEKPPVLLFKEISGIHSFSRPRSHPGWFDVNVNCVDNLLLSEFDVKLFDGQNWEDNIKQIRQSDLEN